MSHQERQLLPSGPNTAPNNCSSLALHSTSERLPSPRSLLCAVAPGVTSQDKLLILLGHALGAHILKNDANLCRAERGRNFFRDHMCLVGQSLAEPAEIFLVFRKKFNARKLLNFQNSRLYF